MRDWTGRIVFVLALGVSITLVAGILIAGLSPGAITSEEVSFLSTLGGAIIGAIATYLGVRRGTDAEHTDDHDETKASDHDRRG